MLSFQFWKSWNKTEQLVFISFSFFILLSIIFFWQSWWVSPAPVIAYDHFQQVQEVESLSHSFQVGLINLSIPAYSYVIFETILGSPLHPNVLASYIFLTALLISFLFFIAIISSLSRFWFLIGMGLVMLFLTSLQMESTEVFGVTDKTVTIVLVLFFGTLAYYFQVIKKETTLTIRLISFLILSVAMAVLIYFFSKVPAPFLHLAVNGLVSGIILSVIFIMMVSHEIVAACVAITAQSSKSSKNLRHFLILTVAYLVNLALMFASKMGFIDWNFFALNSFFVLTVSAVLGVWGFRQRRMVYEHLLPSEPLAVFFYCSMMLTAFAAIGYFAASASDMMMDVLDDLIMAAHLGGGIIFGLYVIANFGPMLVKNLPVFKVLYKPQTMPHFTFRIMSVIATFAILSLAAYWKTYINQATASFYHAYGDLYLSQNDDAAAEGYYQKSIQFRNQNLHTHYALASIYRGRYDSFKEKKEYEKANDRSPSIPVYLNRSEAYSGQGHWLEAALTLDEGRKMFPKSGELQNASGLSHLKLKSIDSALHFFKEAENSRATKQTGLTNYLGAAALFNTKLATDTLISFSAGSITGVDVNKIALANTLHRPILFEGKFNPDSALTVYQASFLCNYFINQKGKADTSLINLALRLARRRENDGFTDQLLVAAAHALYDRGLVKKAFETVREVAYASGDGKTFLLMGRWLLEQNNPIVAAFYFKMAAEKQQPEALYYQAIAESESDSLKKSLISWDSLSRSKNANAVALAALMKKILAGNSVQAKGWTDEEKYYFCRYKIPLQDSITFKNLTSTMVDGNVRALAQLMRAKKWFDMDESGKASYQIQQIGSLNARKIKTEIDQLAFLIACSKQDVEEVQKILNSGIEIQSNLRVYGQALLAEQSGNQKMARADYGYLAKANDQFGEGIAAASRFLARDTTDRLKNFSLLVDGLLAKPNSVKILKQHILECIALGFAQEAQDSLEKLQRLLPTDLFRKFIDSYPDYFKAESK